MRLLLPLMAIIAAIGLFSFYTDPTYQDIKTLQVQQAQLDGALAKAKELRALRDQLVAKRNTFSPEQTTKLEKLLPDNVDNIRLIIDINNVASRHSLPMSNVRLGASSESATARSASAVGASGDAVGSVTLGFTVSANYDTFIAFLQDLEHSERILNVEQFGFKTGLTDQTSYDVTFRTYWLH